MRKKSLFLLVVFLPLSLLAADLPWSFEYLQSTSEKVSSYTQEEKSFSYPAIAKEVLAGREKVWVFAYGSLLNRKSAALTLNEEALDSYQEAVAFRVQRLFNRNLPEGNFPRWGQIKRPVSAVLNVCKTDKITSIVNGVIFSADQQQLQNAIGREVGYDLIPVLVVRYSDMVEEKASPEVIEAYTFAATSEEYVSSTIHPIPCYVEASRAGAKEHGQLFSNLWEATTYLSDGTTPLSEWICGEGEPGL